MSDNGTQTQLACRLCGWRPKAGKNVGQALAMHTQRAHRGMGPRIAVQGWTLPDGLVLLQASDGSLWVAEKVRDGDG